MYKNCMLIVVDGDAHEPVIYWHVIDDDTDKEVAKACAIIGIDPKDETEDIVDAIDNDEAYWYKERFGFQIIPVSNVKGNDLDEVKYIK